MTTETIVNHSTKGNKMNRKVFGIIALIVIAMTYVAFYFAEIKPAQSYTISSLPANTIQFTTPDLQKYYGWTYTNDYSISSGVLTVNSYYIRDRWNGKYRLTTEKIITPQYTIGNSMP